MLKLLLLEYFTYYFCNPLSCIGFSIDLEFKSVNTVYAQTLPSFPQLTIVKEFFGPYDHMAHYNCF